MRETVATWIYFQVCSRFTWVDVCSTQPLCHGIQSAFRRVMHQRPRRRVYFEPFRNNPENNGVDQIVTRPPVDRAAVNQFLLLQSAVPASIFTSCHRHTYYRLNYSSENVNSTYNHIGNTRKPPYRPTGRQTTHKPSKRSHNQQTSPFRYCGLMVQLLRCWTHD